MMDPRDSHFELTPQDRASSLWLRLSGHLEARLQACRVVNDRILPEDVTHALRGEIKTLKHILALGDERPVID